MAKRSSNAAGPESHARDERRTACLAAPLAEAYPRDMCRTVARDERIEGWRATRDLLSVFRPGRVGALAAALAARLCRRLFAAPVRRA